MTGLDLQEAIRKENLSNAYFVILSGYADFEYARRALQNECTDYILKPVDRDMLLKLLNRVSAMRDEDDRMRQKNNKMEKAYLARNQIALIKGKYDDSNLQYVTSQMKCKEGVRYVEIQMAGCDADEDVTDQEMREFQRQMYECCTAFLKDYAENCVFDASADEKIYDVGLIFFQYMAEEAGLDENAYLNGLVEYLGENLSRPVTMLVGKKVQDISLIARSYGNACMLRSFQGFRSKKDIYFYEEEVQVSNDGMVLCKKSLDDLLKVVEQNNHMEIRAAVDRFYGEMSQRGDYLSQLRKNVSRGVLGNVEKEIKEHYADNLTLKGLSEKYYVNSAYLGQLFRKKYGQSFKDYLNNYRMDQAVDLLLHSDKKIIQVAEEVGYHDLDYFVNRFIQVKGCTPAKFRKQMQQ